MANEYIAEYASHAFRRYFSTLSVQKTEADRLNDKAVKMALEGLSETEVDRLRLVYTSRLKTLSEGVQETARVDHVKEKEVWRLIRKATAQFAIARVL